MRLKINYLVIPSITVMVAFLGKFLTREPHAWFWYKNILIKPSITPPDWVFPIAWNIIFILTTFCALRVWNSFKRTGTFRLIMSLFLLNAVLNIAWSYIFFTRHMLGFAIIESALLTFVTIVLAVLIGARSIKTALLLVPYIVWGCFATYLTYHVYLLNS